MQIPATSSAAQAASIAAQAASKDGQSEVGQAATNAQAAHNAVVEKSTQASPDRDAQGQGDGLPGDKKKPIVDELEISFEPTQEPQAAPQLPDQPPSQLDIVG